MTGVIIALSVISAFLLATIIIGSIKLYRMNKNMETLARSLLVFINHSDELNIVDDDIAHSGSDFNFPNSEGF